jgi:hypothetical protein
VISTECVMAPWSAKIERFTQIRAIAPPELERCAISNARGTPALP